MCGEEVVGASVALLLHQFAEAPVRGGLRIELDDKQAYRGGSVGGLLRMSDLVPSRSNVVGSASAAAGRAAIFETPETDRR
jgi:hypothetical protein